MLTFTPSVILSARKKETSLLFANKDYKGSPARSRRKVQTHYHLRGNFFCLWGGAAACKGHQALGRHFGRAAGKAREAISRPHGSEGMPFSQAFFWPPPPKTLRGIKLADGTLGRHLSESHLATDGDGVNDDGKTWHRPRARDASPSLQAGGHHRSRPSMGPMFFC